MNRDLAGQLIAAAALAAYALVLLYMYEPDFQEWTDARVRKLLYELRLRRWRAWWNSLPGWRQEIYEQRHGPQRV